uniref:Uncharacterized protein n=1 Tax=Vespula pensylvanica TaxID=30213 RepID=A0A834NYD1_VESPE|nr:hypothetical protein H0235_009206 [Vespula pensylvanica]
MRLTSVESHQEEEVRASTGTPTSTGCRFPALSNSGYRRGGSGEQRTRTILIAEVHGLCLCYVELCLHCDLDFSRKRSVFDAFPSTLDISTNRDFAFEKHREPIPVRPTRAAFVENSAENSVKFSNAFFALWTTSVVDKFERFAATRDAIRKAME